MARLNGQDYPFKPKSGLAANVNSTANKNSAYDGEIVFTTDGKQLYVFNGTEFEEVNKYTQYFYNSSGAQAGNRFNNWSDLQTSIGGRKVEIQFEQNETIPAGEYNVNNQTWLGGGTNPNEGFIITLPTGVTFSSAINWGATGGLDIRSTSTAPIHVQDYVTTHIFDRCDIGSTTAPFFQVTVNGLHAWSISQGGIIRNRGYEVIEATGTTAYNCYIVISRQGVEAGPENDTVRSDVEVVFLDLVQSSEGATGASTQANLFAGSALQYILFAKANAIGFKDGKPTGINSDNVFDALAELANEKRDIVRDVITSTATVANTTDETTVFTGSIPANTLEVGQVVHADIFGVFSTANASDTFTLRLKIGGTTIASIVSVGKNVTNTPIDVDFIFTIRSLGVSGTVATYSKVSLDNLGTSAGSSGTTTIDTTIAEDVTITIQWGAANVNNSVSITQGWLDIDG